jgi:hypothetical protein
VLAVTAKLRPHLLLFVSVARPAAVVPIRVVEVIVRGRPEVRVGGGGVAGLADMLELAG